MADDDKKTAKGGKAAGPAKGGGAPAKGGDKRGPGKGAAPAGKARGKDDKRAKGDKSAGPAAPSRASIAWYDGSVP